MNCNLLEGNGGGGGRRRGGGGGGWGGGGGEGRSRRTREWERTKYKILDAAENGQIYTSWNDNKSGKKKQVLLQSGHQMQTFKIGLQ